MRLINLKRTSDYKVEEWLKNNIRDITPTQIRWMRDEEIVRFAPFEFYERRKRINNVWIRLSLIAILPAGFILLIGLPFNFIVTGTWGYSGLSWFGKWWTACGLQ